MSGLLQRDDSAVADQAEFTGKPFPRNPPPPDDDVDVRAEWTGEFKHRGRVAGVTSTEERLRRFNAVLRETPVNVSDGVADSGGVIVYLAFGLGLLFGLMACAVVFG